jgi:hypothetical protein
MHAGWFGGGLQIDSRETTGELEVSGGCSAKLLIVCVIAYRCRVLALFSFNQLSSFEPLPMQMDRIKEGSSLQIQI